MNYKITIKILCLILIIGCTFVGMSCFKQDNQLNISGEFTSLRETQEQNKAEYSVYLPNTNKKTKAIIFVPGGGYLFCGEYSAIVPAQWFQQQGFVAVVLNYRLPKSKNPTYPLKDVELLMKQLKSNYKELNIDSVGIMGVSAGGHLAALYSNISKGKLKPDFTILYAPVISMTSNHTHFPSRYNLLGDDKNLFEKYSAELNVTDKNPKTFITVALDDNVVDPINSKLYCNALKEKNVECILQEYPQGSHGIGWNLHKQIDYEEKNRSDVLNWINSL